ncbi:hypothetical protein [Dictyobacter vulcani]|uniref:hypothetical protein n=1 Tax=Dictyobacter vulcani TaxID=2607529 RepID=UPI00124F9409|nr:hypothetical protein [Dictyobacter vulcani]
MAFALDPTHYSIIPSITDYNQQLMDDYCRYARHLKRVRPIVILFMPENQNQLLIALMNFWPNIMG